jgi:hypothetical protein
MARTMTITQEETASTNPLLTGFLLFAVGWLLLAGLAAMVLDSATPADDAAVVAP